MHNVNDASGCDTSFRQQHSSSFTPGKIRFIIWGKGCLIILTLSNKNILGKLKKRTFHFLIHVIREQFVSLIFLNTFKLLFARGLVEEVPYFSHWVLLFQWIYNYLLARRSSQLCFRPWMLRTRLRSSILYRSVSSGHQYSTGQSVKVIKNLQVSRLRSSILYRSVSSGHQESTGQSVQVIKNLQVSRFRSSRICRSVSSGHQDSTGRSVQVIKNLQVSRFRSASIYKFVG